MHNIPGFILQEVMANNGSNQANVDTLSRDLALLGVQPGRAVTISLLKGQWDGIVCRMGVNQRREHKAAYDRSKKHLKYCL